ncbi:MAG: NADH-quinone oxidoreductase subunit H [Polyangiaceae bacterium]|nr:NADH-quinone oxidoreductase subunit H [Polyangiaceae bacterium]
MPVHQVVLHLLCLLTLPPLLVGIIVKVKALFAGRVGAPLLQPYLDLFRLYRKGTVLSRTSTWLFVASPVVAIVTMLLAGLLVPFGYPSAPLAFTGDLVLFAYLLGLARFFTLLAALDTGSAFEGMGAAREATWASLAEPALFLGLLALVRRSGSMSLSTVLDVSLDRGWGESSAVLLLVFVSLFVVFLAENCRIPFDDPNTHLELTMIHEAMVLDHSGPALGLILQGAATKLFVLGALVVHTILPMSRGSSVVGWASFLGAMIGLAVAVGVIESTMARVRMKRVASLLIAACVLAGFGVILTAR